MRNCVLQNVCSHVAHVLCRQGGEQCLGILAFVGFAESFNDFGIAFRAGIPDGILFGQKQVVEPYLFCRGFGRDRIFCRWNYLKVKSEAFSGAMHEPYLGHFTRCLGNPECPVLVCPDEHVTYSGVECGDSVISGELPCHGIELCIVVYLEFYLCPFDRIPGSVQYLDAGPPCRDVALYHIDFRE